MRIYALPKGLCLVVVLCMSCCYLQVKAQAWELGVQSGSWSVIWADDGPVDVSQDDNFDNNLTYNLGGAIFLHKEKGNRYIQLNFFGSYNNRYSQHFRNSGDVVVQGYNNGKTFNGRIAVELGRKFSLGKKFRLLLGGEIGLGQSLFNRNVQRNGYNNGSDIGYSITEFKGLGSTSLTGRLVGRADYRIGSRCRLGVAFTYGANLSFFGGLPSIQTTNYLMDGTEDGNFETESSTRQFNFSSTGLSRPLITLSFLLKKPE